MASMRSSSRLRRPSRIRSRTSARVSPKKREVDAEPVVFPRRGAALAEELVQPFLAFCGQPAHLQGPAAGPGPRRSWRDGRGPRLGLVMLLGDQPGGQELVQARIQRSVGKRAERAEHGGKAFTQFVAVHRCSVKLAEHGELKYA